MITSLHKAVMVAGGREVILYTTIMGAVGILAPFISKENVELFQAIEMHMRQENPPLCGRDHLTFRSFYFPVKVLQIVSRRINLRTT
jgi:splicing factor 3B subunit 3